MLDYNGVDSQTTKTKIMNPTFKSVHINSCFDFDHFNIPQWWTGAVGPWRKISARKYSPLANPEIIHRIGTIKTTVVLRLDLNAGV